MSSPRLLKGRCSTIGHYYSVTTVTLGRRRTFVDKASAGMVIERMMEAESRHAVHSVAWVVMPDHLHWLFRLESGTLSRHMQRFKMLTAQAVNRHMGTEGALWQAGFHDHCIRDEHGLMRAARYLIDNPVRAGLVENLEDYPYWRCTGVKSSGDLW